MNWVLLKNSVLAGGLATLVAVGFGIAAALCLGGLPQRFRNLLLGLAAAALALPPFLVTNCWLQYLGANGVWRAWLPLDILTVGGTVWILALILWPLTFFAAGSAWRRLEPAQLESDASVAGWHLLRGLLWPLAKTSVIPAAVVTLVLALNNFAVPAILQVKVFPAEMWIRFNTTFDTPGTLRLSWPLVLGPILLVIFFMRHGIAWPHVGGSIAPETFRRQLGRGWFWSSAGITAALCLLSVALPVFQLASVKRTWTELSGAIAAGKPAIWHSCALAAGSATIITALGLSSSGTERARRFGILLWVPFLLPGVLLGIGLIYVFNRPWSSAIYQSSAIVIVAFVIRYLAVSWSTISHARRMEDRDLNDAASLEGVTRWQLLRYIRWPQIRPTAIAVWYIVFLLCLWDVESMVLITPPGGETLALRVFNLLHYGHNAQVNALCLTLLAIAVAPLVVRQIAAFFLKSRFGTGTGARTTASMVGLSLFAGCSCLVFSGCGGKSGGNEPPLESKLFSRIQIIGTRGTGVGELNKPRSVAVDKQDNLYVVDMTGRVQKFSGAGIFQLSWQMPQTDLGKPKGMCRDQDGNIVVVEPHYQRLNHFSTDGKLVAQWGISGTNQGEFKLPRAVSITAQGEIYVSEYGLAERVQRFRLEASPNAGSPVPSTNSIKTKAQFLGGFGKAGNGPGEFNRPEGIFVDAQNRVFVADSCNHRIQVFSADGTFIRQYGKPGTGPGELSYPYDICVDKEGRQYVCEFGNSRIQIFDDKDQPLEIIGGPGAEPGRFSNPWSIALDSAGNLYVADSLNHRVQKLIRRNLVAGNITSRFAADDTRSRFVADDVRSRFPYGVRRQSDSVAGALAPRLLAILDKSTPRVVRYNCDGLEIITATVGPE